MTENWKEIAAKLKFVDGKSWTETAAAVAGFFPGKNPQQVLETVRSSLRRLNTYQTKEAPVPVAITEVDLVAVLKAGATLEQIADKLTVSERVAKAQIEDLCEQGHCIDETSGVYRLSKVPHSRPKTFDCDWNGERIIRFGQLSDNHFGSIYTQITHLHTAYEVFRREGITKVYNAGDLTEGEKMRPGHEYECYVHGADAHTDEVVKNYPQVSGIETEYILGNHDLSFVKHVGLDISRQISSRRKDLICLGHEQAYVNLTPNCSLELRHPGGGSAYALSYKTQKMIDSMSGGEKPSILAVGHYHKCEYLFYRNIHCLQSGTTEAQSGFMKRMGLAAHMGFWIVEAHVDDTGQINRFKPEWYPFYTAIKDDYKNWR